MGYYLINKNPIFIFTKHIRMFSEKLFKDKDAMWIANSLYGGSNSEEREKRTIDYLEQKFKDDPDNFYLNWVWFDIKKNESFEVFNLFCDYCYYYNYPFSWNRESSDDEYSPISHPFSISYKEAGSNSWLSRFKKGVYVGKIKIVVDPMRINRVVGTLQEFIVYTRDFVLFCGKNFEVYPTNFSVKEKIDTQQKERAQKNISLRAQAHADLMRCAPREYKEY